MGRNLKGYKVRDCVSRQPGRLLSGPGMAGVAAYFGSGRLASTSTESNFKAKSFCEIMSKEYNSCMEKKNYVVCDYIREILVANGCIK